MKRISSLLIVGLLLSLLVGACQQQATPAATKAAATAAATSAATKAAATTAAATTAAATKAASPAATQAVTRAGEKDVILATTTSTKDSGLLDVLLPDFQKKTGYNVKPISVGSGQAMTLGERGEADVLLVHAPASEQKFMAAKHGVARSLVMHNDFVILGPEADPVGIKGEKSAVDALKKIAEKQSPFITRGDNSGTHQLEMQLWKAAGIEPKGSWYQSTGQGMGNSLRIASEKEAYIISDRGTFLATKALTSKILVEGDNALLNVYSVIQVNPDKNSQINAAGAKAFAEYMVAPETQAIIKTFGVDKYGQPLFYPDATKKYEDLGLTP